MALEWLDHVNLRTTRLAEMSKFYIEALGLEIGRRPPFGFAGAWHYCGDRPVVHLVEVGEAPELDQLQIEHWAFRAEGLDEFLSTLRALHVAYSVAIVPEWEVRQVNIHDPDGNHIEIQFAADEEADLSPFAG